MDDLRAIVADVVAARREDPDAIDRVVAGLRDLATALREDPDAVEILARILQQRAHRQGAGQNNGAPALVEPAPPSEVAQFARVVESRDQNDIATAVMALLRGGRTGAIEAGVVSGVSARDILATLRRFRGSYALCAAPRIQSALHALGENNADEDTLSRFASMARVWAMMYCPQAAYYNRGFLLVTPVTHAPADGSAARIVSSAGLCVTFHPEEYAPALLRDVPVKWQKRICGMMRSYDREHCHVVVVNHPDPGIGTWGAAFQARWRGGRVSQKVVRSDSTRALLHACGGDLSRASPHLRDSESLVVFRRKKFLHWDYQSRYGTRRGSRPAQCARCAKTVKNAPLCVGCGTSYCDATCQRADWPRHKAECKRLAAAAAALYGTVVASREAILNAVEDATSDPAAVAGGGAAEEIE